MWKYLLEINNSSCIMLIAVGAVCAVDLDVYIVIYIGKIGDNELKI